MERGEVAIVSLQFGALIVVVLIIANITPGQSSQSMPVIGSVYWGSPQQGGAVGLSSGQLTKVHTNQTTILAYFTVAYSTQVSSVSASRLCLNSTSGTGESTVYTTIPWGYDRAKQSYYVTVSPTGQRVGLGCTYTIKITDGLSQTATWLGTVELT